MVNCGTLLIRAILVMTGAWAEPATGSLPPKRMTTIHMSQNTAALD